MARVVSGGTPSTKNPEFWDGNIPWVTPADLSKLGSLEIHEGSKTLTDRGLAKSSATIVPPGSVILSSRAPIGYVAINGAPITTNQGCKSFIPSNLLDAGFLAHYLLHIKPLLESLGTGATFKELSINKCREIQVPLPPPDEQRRIAGILDQAADSILKCMKQLEEVENVRVATFENLISKTNQTVSIGSLLSSTQYGTAGKASDHGSHPILRMGNLTSRGNLDLANLKYIDIPKSDLARYTLRNGDILFNRTNSKELVGKTALFRGQDQSMAYAGYLVRCRVNALATPEFIVGYLNSRYGKALLTLRAKAIVGMANINATELKRMPIPSVAIIEQQTYSSIFRQCELVVSLLARKLSALRNLQASLQSRAFQGEL